MKKNYSKSERQSWINGLNLGKMRGAQEERNRNGSKREKTYDFQREYSPEYFESLITKVADHSKK